MLNNESIFVTEDFDEWKHGTRTMLDTTPSIPNDIEVFPEELKPHVAGYMLAPVASANGTLLMSCVRTVANINQAIEAFVELNEYCDVYLYKVTLHHAEVDGYKINDMLIQFATTSKKSV